MSPPDLVSITQDLRTGGWVLGHRINGGGGGDVYYCYNTSIVDPISIGIQKLARIVAPMVSDPIDVRAEVADSIVRPLHDAFVTHPDVIGVAKLIKEPGERSTREVQAMERCSHPNLTRLLAADKSTPARWFVMQLHPKGDLEAHQPDYLGKPLAVLKKARVLVDALRVLHGEKLVHRDIKPHNIFVSRTGDWVLGDLGVVFDSEADRLTLDAQTLVSKDWRPDWVATLRPDSWGPDVDIFGLAKVIYFMISGKRVPASQLDADGCDVRGLYKDVPGIDRVHDFLSAHVVTKKRDLQSQTAEAFASAIDALITDLERPVRKRHVFGFISTHSTTQVQTTELEHLSSTPIPLGRGDRWLYIRVRLVKNTSGPGAPLGLRAWLQARVNEHHKNEWGWDGNLTMPVPTEVDDGVIATGPGVWSDEWVIELPAELRLPATCQFRLAPRAFADNFRITGLQVNVD